MLLALVASGPTAVLGHPPVELSAGAGDYVLEAWTTDHGLPQGSVLDIVQTRNGYLWIATFGGLARFDGVRFEVFDLANTPGLRQNRVVALLEDRRGGLWLGLEDEGLARWHDGSVRSFTTADGLPAGTVTDLAQTSDGAVWVATTTGLARLHDGGVTVYGPDRGLPRLAVPALLVDRSGVLWAGSRGGLARLENGSFSLLEGASAPPGAMVQALFEDRDGTLWVASESALSRKMGRGFTEVLAAESASSAVRTIVQDRDGSLWVGSNAPPLRRLSAGVTAGGPATQLRILSAESEFPMRAALLDREGNLWFGSDGRGLVRIRRRPLRRYTIEDGLPFPDVLPILGDGSGGLWIGSGCNVLTRFRDLEFRNLTRVGDRDLGCVFALHRERSGALWIGHTAVLTRLDQGSARHWDLRERWRTQRIQAVHEDRAGTVWVGTSSGLLRLADGVLRPVGEPAGLAGADVRFFADGQDGALWIGTRAGLVHHREGGFRLYTSRDGLSPGMVRAIHRDSDGTLWIGTYGGGLSRFRDHRFTRYTNASGLFDDVVSCILEDDAGNLWMSGNQGLFFVARRELNAFADGTLRSVTSVAYRRADGMAEGNGGTQPNCWRSQDGRLWFATIDGLALVDPARLDRNRLPPPVVIEDLRRRTGPLPLAAEVVVPPRSRDLEIRYTAPTFVRPELARFRYRLEGYDPDWVEAHERRTAFYTSVPPGSYRFRVIASNGEGVWNSAGAVVDLRVLPPFWSTWWFRFLAAATATGLLIATIRFRTRRVERRARALEIEIEERKRAAAERLRLIGELERSHARLQQLNYAVAHDLRTPLVTIGGFIRQLESDLDREELDRAREDLGRVLTAARTMGQLLDELLRLSGLSRPTESRSEVSLRQLADEAVALTVQPDAEPGIEVQIDDDLPTAWGDTGQLRQLVRVLIENAVRFLGNQPSPRIEIGFRRSGVEPCFFVRDNGMGIEPAHHERIFGLFRRLGSDGAGAGVGLTLARRIVELHGGRLWVESGGLGQGSTFCFTLPAREATPSD